MIFIEVINKNEHYDSLGKLLAPSLAGLGVRQVRTSVIYFIEPDIDVNYISMLLKDGITDDIFINAEAGITSDRNFDIVYKPGVMDPAAVTLKEHLESAGKGVFSINTVRRYYLSGCPDISIERIREYARNTLYNPLIEDVIDKYEYTQVKSGAKTFNLRHIDMNTDLERLSSEMVLSLTLEEMNIIKDYFAKEGRKPTDIELETIAQTWSEHCVHKSFKSAVKYKDRNYSNLFKETIVAATKKINHPDAIVVFSDNAGIFRFDEHNNVCFKVETHNHPSALEPYGGAGTGIGGVIRDIIGTGLGAKPIANTDVFCVGSQGKDDEIPEGTIMPEKILKGIVSGVRDYGNRMGIPTVNGAVHFHEDYVGNPLVFAGSLGIMKSTESFKTVHKGDRIILVGGKTGRDGIHGATFSSVSLTDESQEISSGAVQIGNPIEEKKMLDAIMEAKGLYNAITDCGAGGLSSAVGEMGEHTGAVVHLEKVPLKYEGLTYDEIWISESQERMVLSVSPDNVEAMRLIMEKHNTGITDIGEFSGKGLILKYNDIEVARLDMDFLHNGVPLPVMTASQYKHSEKHDLKPVYGSIEESAELVMHDPDVRVKDWIIRQYDHEVQAQTMIKPLSGKDGYGVSDAAVIIPIESSGKCIVMGNGINPHFGKLNARKMTYAAIDEALRNVIAQGGNMEHTAMLDNFSWGNLRNENTMGAFIESAEACAEYAVELGIPFISGKDSLNNYFEFKGREIEIPNTLLASVISITDISRIHNSYFSYCGSLIYLVGPETTAELGGSVLHRALKMPDGGIVPAINVKRSADIHRTVSRLNEMNIIEACHDVSDGGIMSALLEMTFGMGISADIKLNTKLAPAEFLFSETQSRYIMQIDAHNAPVFEKAAGEYAMLIGRTAAGNVMRIDINGSQHTFELERMKNIWKGN